MPDAEVNVKIRAETAEASRAVGDFEGRLAGLGGWVGRNENQLMGFLNVGRLALTTIQRMEIASLALQNAQDRVSLSQERVNRAVEKYGVASDQARDAQKELEISTRSLQIAQDRFAVRQAFFALTVIPEVVMGLKSIAQGLQVATAATKTATAATQAHSIALAIRNAMMGPGGWVMLAAGLAAGAAAPAAIMGMHGGGGGTQLYGDLNISSTPGSRLQDELTMIQQSRTQRT